MAASEGAAKFREETPQMGQGVYMLRRSMLKGKKSYGVRFFQGSGWIAVRWADDFKPGIVV